MLLLAASAYFHAQIHDQFAKKIDITLKNKANQWNKPFFGQPIAFFGSTSSVKGFN